MATKQLVKIPSAGNIPCSDLPRGVELMVPVERIMHDERKTRPIDEKKVQELMRSFLSKGQKQSINIRPNGDWYLKVTFGEHRAEAAIRLSKHIRPEDYYKAITDADFDKWKEIRAVVEDQDEFEAMELKLTENAHRNTFVDVWKEGEMLNDLCHRKHDGNVDALIDSLGKPEAWIRDRLEVYHRLAPELVQFIGHGLTAANVISIVKEAPADVPGGKQKQMDLAELIIRSRRVNLGQDMPKIFAGSRAGHFGDPVGGGGGYAGGRTKVTILCTCPVEGCGNVHAKGRNKGKQHTGVVLDE